MYRGQKMKKKITNARVFSKLLSRFGLEISSETGGKQAYTLPKGKILLNSHGKCIQSGNYNILLLSPSVYLETVKCTEKTLKVSLFTMN